MTDLNTVRSRQEVMEEAKALGIKAFHKTTVRLEREIAEARKTGLRTKQDDDIRITNVESSEPVEQPAQKKAAVEGYDEINQNELKEAAIRRQRRKSRDYDSLDLKLAAKPIPGFHLRWVNDTPGRLQEMEERGYTFVLVNGERQRRYAGVDKSNKKLDTYLMKIPQDWYDQDQNEKLRMNAQMEEDLLNAQVRDQHGNPVNQDTSKFRGTIQIGDKSRTF